MAGKSKASRRDQQPSIKFKWIPLEAEASVDISTLSESNKSSKQSQTKSPDLEILTTSQLVSVIGKVWECAKPKLTTENDVALRYTGCERSETSSFDFGTFHIDPKHAKHYYNMVNSSFECIDITQKTSLLAFSSRLNSPMFGRNLHCDDSFSFIESWKVNVHPSLSVSVNLDNLHERLYRKSSLVHTSQFDCNKTGEIRSKTPPADNLSRRCNGTKFEDTSLDNVVEPLQSAKECVTSLDSDNPPKTVTIIKQTDVVSSIQSSKCHTGLQDFDKCGNGKVEDGQEKKNMLKEKECFLEVVPTKELRTESKSKPVYARPDWRHALAGALSGTCVSLCLHPVDTIKTVIQSSSMAEKSVFDVVRSIISDRGLTGLYRGIASNIASSAPISAVYTYTYESVKRAMLPFLPKEYHSIAHCMAGGCASIATSVIFTPSERIKQQMQVSSQYQNSWAALVGILGRGGLSSLYAGWGAVLCRNIPHSIIKFYTYETLKQLLSPSAQPDARPSTSQTLLSGGLAGCTAALFTTPFDVVKTRLQTQIPGSLGKYNGVFHALGEIFKDEGLKGLYRGLTPRLIMYVSQGALFFASYEIFKSMFTMEIPEICTAAIQDKQNIQEDDSTFAIASLGTSSTPR